LTYLTCKHIWWYYVIVLSVTLCGVLHLKQG